ncbi:hypothetical protein [Arthrobacter sp. Soil762]|nr:hypothetical protein [Arthrobacter sp. Soil762]
MGYSGGGAAALAFAAKHPEHLLSLTLLEGGREDPAACGSSPRWGAF